MPESLLTAAARVYISKLSREIRPLAGSLDRRLRMVLRARGYGAAETRACLAISPVAAARVRTLGRFLEQVEYNGRRLAKLNVEPAELQEILQEFGQVLECEFPGRFQPAREQLFLATTLALKDAYYEVRESEAQAFFGLDRAETQANSLDDLLQRFVRVLTQAFRARAGRVLILAGRTSNGLGKALYIERGSSAERLIGDPLMRGRYASYWSLPIEGKALDGVRSGSAYVLQFGFSVPYPWLPRELTLLQAAAERCREAIDKARLREQVRLLEAETRRAEEDERGRIARELHDEAGQSLLVLRLQLEMIEREAAMELRPRLAEARAITERTVDEIRRIISALSPTVLDRLGLAAALRQLATRFRKLHPAVLQVRISGAWRKLPRPAAEVIYRIAQESLQNIVKHSQATHVNLSLYTSDKSIRLRVVDNGAGFSAETASNKSMSFGLTGMRERAALLGGKLVVRSAPGRGAAVSLELPLPATVGNHDKDSHIVN